MGAPEEPCLTWSSCGCLSLTGGHRDRCYLAMVTTFQGPTRAVSEAAKEEKGKRTKHRAPDERVGSFCVVYGIDPQGDQTTRAGTRWVWPGRRDSQNPLLRSHLSAHPRPTLLYPSLPEFHGDESCTKEAPSEPSPTFRVSVCRALQPGSTEQ